MFDVSCIPTDDPCFANAARVVVAFVRIEDPDAPQPDLGPWEVALRRGFGYERADARIGSERGGRRMVNLYRDGVVRAGMRARLAGDRRQTP